MSLEAGSPKSTVITREGDQRRSSYFLNSGDNRTKLSYLKFGAIKTLIEGVPDLVKVRALKEPGYTWNEDYAQLIAEIMHDLSQPAELGDLLKWESHGDRIVGYRLTQAIDIVDKREKPTPKPEPRGLMRLLTHPSIVLTAARKNLFPKHS